VQNKGVGGAIPRGRAKASCGDVLHDVAGAGVCRNLNPVSFWGSTRGQQANQGSLD
jgi:hypothetical protein